MKKLPHSNNFYKKKQFLSTKVFLILLLLLGTNFVYSQSPSTFTASGTWICPRGVTTIQVEAIGGGAGGRTSGSTNGNVGGGGGGGAYSKRINVTVTPGTTYNITVGAGGAASTAGAASTVTFGAVTITAAGGSVGVASTTNTTLVTGGLGGNVAASAGDAGSVFAGGNGGSGWGTGSAGSGGGGGSAAGSSGTGNNGGNATATNNPGAGGGFKTNFGGAGGAGGNNGIGSAASTAAGNYGGGGGGGGHRSMSGGAGQSGVVIITFTCPTETAAAGADQLTCLSTATLAGNAPTSAGLNGLWTKISGAGTITTPSSPTSVVTGITAGTSSVFRWTIDNGRCGSSFDEVTITSLGAAITPSPATDSSGVCFAGVGAITSISWAAVPGATSYDVYFGAGSLPVPVTATVGTNSYTTGTLLASTNYQWRVVARSTCGAGPTSLTWNFTTKSTLCYCTPTGSNPDGNGITKVVYSTVSNTTTGNAQYVDYTTTHIGNAIQGSTMPVAVTTSTGNNEYNIYIYVDWNNDADFSDTGEQVFTGKVKSNTINGVINIPPNESVGYHTMRIGLGQKKRGSDNVLPIPCYSGAGKIAYEDYTINVTAAAGCSSAPTVATSPANASVLNGGSTSFTASFGNLPTSYFWEVSTDGGINFTTLTNGGVYSTATTATLTLIGVTSGMNGFIYRVSATNACGTSAYTTLRTLYVTTTYCTPSSTSSTHYISGISSDGNLNDASNSPTTYSTGGYGNYTTTTIARQIPGGGININILLTGAGDQFVECYVDWNGDGTFTETTTEEVYNSLGTAFSSTSFGFVVPVSQTQGNYKMRIRTRAYTDSPIIGPCTTGYLTGETEDYTIAIVPDCAAIIDSVTDGSVCGANNPVTISAVGLGGTTKYRWYTSLTGGTYVETSTGTYSPTLSATQIYYVTAFNGSCESLVRTRVTAKVIPIANISFTPSSPTVCGEDVVVAISSASDLLEQDIFTEDFEGTTIGLTPTMPTGVVPTSAGADSSWQVKTSTYRPATTAVWRPAINSGSIDNNFGFSSSDYSGANIVTRYTTTSSYSTMDFVSLSLSFDIYFSHYSSAGEHFKAQISLDNTNWVDLASYGSDQGSASRFKTVTIAVPDAYRNQTAVYLRFQYTSAGWSDGVAIDNIRFYGIKQLNTTFSWSSATPVSGYTDLACSNLYTNQLVSTIYLKPSLTQMEATSFPIAVTSTLANGCPISQVITVANNSRVWKGLDVVDATNWNDVDNWKPAAIPTIDNCVIIPNTAIVKGTAYHAYAKNLVVKSTGNLNVQPGNTITVKEWVNVNDAAGGVFELENTASLVQVDNVAPNTNNNIGKIKYKRNTSLKRYDYTYLSSPVEGQIVNNITQAPYTTGPVYKWNPIVVNTNGGQGNWENALGNTMGIARGYAVQSPDSFPLTSSIYNGLFNGKPNNGIITIPVSRGAMIESIFPDPPNFSIGSNGTIINPWDDNWNLIGNPYPSSIRGSQFLIDNQTKIEGNIRIWTHATLASQSQANPFYGSFGYNYTPTDYLSYCFTGTSCCPLSPNEIYVGAGQGFFVQMINGPATNDFVTFSNTQRGTSYDNSFFYRNANPSSASNTNVSIDVNNLKRNRIWLDLVNSSNQSSRILIGNIEGATNGKDNLFDVTAETISSFSFYSLISIYKFIIQGRALPFDITDEVPLGIKVPTAGNYSIAIAAVDGAFVEKKVFVKDMLLNTVHNLKIAPYHFTSAAGQFDNRFKIVYHNAITSNKILDYENTVNVIANDVIEVQSTNESIESITVFDILGRTLGTYNKINANEFNISNLIKNNATLLLKVKLQNGAVVGKKVIY